MRGSILLAMMMLSSAASAQTDPRERFDESPAATADNGSTRVGRRIGAPIDNRIDTRPTASAPLVQPAGSAVHIYKPGSLNDLAREFAKKPH